MEPASAYSRSIAGGFWNDLPAIQYKPRLSGSLPARDYSRMLGEGEVENCFPVSPRLDEEQ
jgi:hypothetical protein